MKNNKPKSLTSAEWAEIVTVPAVREAWGLEHNVSPQEFARMVYAAKFQFESGAPGYCGDLYILQGDILTDAGPMLLRRDFAGNLIPS